MAAPKLGKGVDLMSWFLRAGLVLCISFSSLYAQPADTGPFGQLAEKLGATATGRNMVLPLRVFIRPTGAANQAVARAARILDLGKNADYGRAGPSRPTERVHHKALLTPPLTGAR
jgi:hypothetical protein